MTTNATEQTALVHAQATAVEAMMEWTPDALRQRISFETQMRGLMVEYFRSQMKQGTHFYTLPGQGDRKPALSKEGALNLCSLLMVRPEPEPPHETFHEDGHYTVRTRVHLVSLKTGAIVATGDGSCSTRESKYAHRWVWPNEVPDHIPKETIEKREFKKKDGGKATKYKMPNEDLADQYNTVLKMSDKRGTVAAALKLPLVSELFTQDLDEQIAERQAEQSREAAKLTQQQMNEIGHLAKEMVGNGHWADIDELRGFLKKTAGVEERLKLNAEQADRVIAELKGKLNGSFDEVSNQDNLPV